MDGERAARADGCGPSYDIPWAFGGVVGGMTDEEIEDLCQSQLMWRIVTLLVDDAMKLDPDMSGPTLGALDEVWDYLESRHWSAAEHQALYYSRQYGGGAVAVVVDDGRAMSEPIDLLSINDIVAFVPVRKRFITPGPASANVRGQWWGQQWGRAAYYTITPWTGGISGAGAMESWESAGLDPMARTAGLSQVHPSRVIAYPYRRLDWLQARRFPQWKGWGPGVVEGVADAFLSRTRGVLRTGDIVNSFGYDFVKMPGLHDLLGSAGGNARFANFLSWLKQCRDMTGTGVPIVATGPDVESITPVSRTVSGLGDLIEAQRSFLLDVCEYPRVVIFGTTSGGLSGKDEGEWQSYYQLVSSFVEGTRWAGIRHAAILAMAARNGPTSGRVDMEIQAAWGSLAEERESDRAEARHKDSQSRERDAAILGLSPADLIKYDNTIEAAYPGIQADLENGDLTPGPQVLKGAPGGAGGAAAGGGDSLPPIEAGALGATTMPGAGPLAGGGGLAEGADASVPMASQGATSMVGSDEAAPPPAPTPVPRDLITEAEARRMLRCGSRTFLAWVESGTLHPFYVGNGRRYSLAEVMKAATTPPPKPAATSSSPDDGDDEERDDTNGAGVEDGGRADAYRADPFPNEHAARQASPTGLTNFRRGSKGPRGEKAAGVQFIYGKKHGHLMVQSIRFKASQWSPSEAREWLKAHGYKSASFEAASGGRTDAKAEADIAARLDALAVRLPGVEGTAERAASRPEGGG